MSEESNTEVLGIEPATVSGWLDHAAEQCDKINKNFMKDLNLPKIEMDELWVIVQKK
jgi:hypothetical protein